MLHSCMQVQRDYLAVSIVLYVLYRHADSVIHGVHPRPAWVLAHSRVLTLGGCFDFCVRVIAFNCSYCMAPAVLCTQKLYELSSYI